MVAHRSVLAVLCLAMLSAFTSGCNEKANSNWCPGRNPDDNCSEDPAPKACKSKADCGPPLNACDVDTGLCVQCNTSADCSAPLGACNTQLKACVQCTASEATGCAGPTPVCGGDDKCRACASHAECTNSHACLPDGSCAPASSVAYVIAAPAGADNSRCGLTNPCASVSAALATGLPLLKLSGTIDEGVIVDSGRMVTFLADPGAKLKHSSGEPILTVRGDGTSLQVYDLSLSEAPNSANGFGLLVPAGAGSPTVSLTRVTIANDPAQGISVSGGTLRISQSIISSNTGGGIAITNATFAVIGNVFFNNGNDTSTTGGLFINSTQSAANRVEFNSFSRNKAQDAVGTGIQCTAGGFTARNNVLSDNGTVTNSVQVGGGCSHAYSIVRPGALPNGPGNKADDPKFRNAAMGDLHILPGSAAIGGADPGTDLSGIAARDIDGDLRKAPADIGADQVP